VQHSLLYILTVEDNLSREEGLKIAQSLPSILQESVSQYKTEGDFQRSLLSKLMLKKALGDFGREEDLNRIQKNEFGKFFIEGNIDFSISHSGDKVLLALAENHKIGVDVELKTKGSLALAERFFCEEEVEWLKAQSDLQEAFVFIWTRKEALVKAAGTGIRMPLKSFSVLNESLDFMGQMYFLQTRVQRNASEVLSVSTSEKSAVQVVQIPYLSII